MINDGINWEDFDWANIVDRLTMFAASRIKRMPVNVDCADIVYDAIKKTINSERPWNSGNVELEEHLKGVIRSIVSHIAEANVNRKEIFIENNEQFDIFLGHQYGEMSPEDNLYEKDMRDNFIDYLSSKDVYMAEMAKIMIEKEISKNIDLAKSMKKSISEINNIKKKLKRESNYYFSPSNQDEIQSPKRIFISHAREDGEKVRMLYDRLKKVGFSPWLDAVDLIPGRNWHEEIQKIIETSPVRLFCLSKKALEKESYVQRESRYALSAYANRRAGSADLIPVRLDNCEVPDIPIAETGLSLRDLHCIDLFEDEAFEKLVRAIKRIVSPSPTRPSFTAFPIEEIEGVGLVYGKKLSAVGITNTKKLLDRCFSAKGRREVACETGLDEIQILKWVNLADLMRISGIGKQFSELLEAAGVDTVKELRNRRAGDLSVKMKEINAEKKLTRSPPSEKQVASWVDQAKKLLPLKEESDNSKTSCPI